MGGSCSFLGISCLHVPNCYNNLLVSAKKAWYSSTWKSTLELITTENTVNTTDALGCSLRLADIWPRLPPLAHAIQQAFAGVSDLLGSPSGCSDSQTCVSGIQPPSPLCLLSKLFLTSEKLRFVHRFPGEVRCSIFQSPENLVPLPTLPLLSCDFKKTLNCPLVVCLFSLTGVDLLDLIVDTQKWQCKTLITVNLFHSTSFLIDYIVSKKC